MSANDTTFEFPGEDWIDQSLRLRALARRLLHVDAHAAEDVVQEAWLTWSNRREQLPARALPLLVRRIASKRRRSEDRRRAREARAAREGTTDSVACVLAREETRQRIVDAVRELPEAQRTTIVLRYFEMLPPRAIARRLGLPVDTVKTHLKRGLARLRGRLAHEGEARDALRTLACGPLPPNLLWRSWWAPKWAFAVAIMSTSKLMIGGFLAVALALFFLRGTPEEPTFGTPEDSATLTRSGSPTEPTDDGGTIVERAPFHSPQIPNADAPEPTTPPPARHALVTGCCVEVSSNLPLANVPVRIERTRKTAEGGLEIDILDTTRTLGDGTFTLRCAPLLEKVTVRIAGEVWCPREGRLDPLEAGSRLDLLTIPLLPGHIVRGRVENEAGEPVANVPLALEDVPFAIPALDSRWDPSALATSDEDGRFTFHQRVPAGAWRLTTSPNTFALRQPSSVDVDPRSPITEVRVVVALRGRVQGRLSLVHESEEGAAWMLATTPVRRYVTQVRRDGRFAITAKPGDTGPVTLRLLPGPFEAMETAAMPWGTRDLVVPVQRAGSFALEVVDAESDEPIEDYVVTCHSQEFEDLTRAPWESMVGVIGPARPRLAGPHPRGVATVQGVAMGDHVLQVHPTDTTHLPSRPIIFTMSPAGMETVRIRLLRAVTLTVTVQRSDGTPEAGTGVQLIEPRSGEPVTATSRTQFGQVDREPKPGIDIVHRAEMTNTLGQVTFVRPPSESELALRVEGGRHPTVVRTGIRLASGDANVTIVLPAGARVEGQVQPLDILVSKPSVVLVPPGEFATYRGNRPHTRVSEDGTFTLRDVPPGSWDVFLVAEPAGEDALLTTIEVEEGETHTLTLHAPHLRPGTFEGKVTLQEGSPGGTILALYGAGNIPRVVVRDDGSFRFEDLKPATYHVFAELHDEGSDTRISVPIEGTVTIEPGGNTRQDLTVTWRTLTFRLRPLDGTSSFTGRTFYLNHYVKGGFPLHRVIVPEADGRVTLPFAPRGAFHLQDQADLKVGTTIAADVEGDLGDVPLARLR
ncbi:MAG: sigma-70 family RNA polymerase sigma factor [Planctomycetes bacterium]|nr:sigma-70 family RNA polymerase sigma factor [Planctomycetota bacterium]